jgi:hypothetical protein
MNEHLVDNHGRGWIGRVNLYCILQWTLHYIQFEIEALETWNFHAFLGLWRKYKDGLLSSFPLYHEFVLTKDKKHGELTKIK